MTWKNLLHNRSVVLGGVLILSLFVIAVIGPEVAPNDPFQIDLTRQFEAPCRDFPFGTDHLGRCVLSRLLFGGSTSLGASVSISAAIMFIGMGIGLLAGMGNQAIDFVIMRIVDMLLSFPTLVLTLAVIGMLGPSLLSAAIGICLSWWPIYARLVRGIVLSAREKEFVVAARLIGTSGIRMAIRHILPQTLPPVLVLASLETGTMIMVFSGLGFLGLGVQPPQPEWGAMLNEARSYIFTAPYLMIAPGISIFTAVLGFSLFGEGLRETMQIKEVNQW
jgi:peptide/nickel transport system permease protein